jgi:hypothetical protein
MIEVFAITVRDDLPRPAGEELERVCHEGMAGVFIRREARPEASAEALWRHEQVVEDLMQDRAVLPLRYGTILRDEGELRGVMEERTTEFAQLLDLVRGRVELAVRVLAESSADKGEEKPASGRAYMETLARRRKSSEEAAAALEPLEGVAEAAVKRESAGDLTRLSFLVERGRVEDFNLQLDQLRGEHPELNMTCTGPWPPYSFVSGGSS